MYPCDPLHAKIRIPPHSSEVKSVTFCLKSGRDCRGSDGYICIFVAGIVLMEQKNYTGYCAGSPGLGKTVFPPPTPSFPEGGSPGCRARGMLPVPAQGNTIKTGISLRTVPGRFPWTADSESGSIKIGDAGDARSQAEQGNSPYSGVFLTGFFTQVSSLPSKANDFMMYILRSFGSFDVSAWAGTMIA
jgi:hypothetical protein